MKIARAVSVLCLVSGGALAQFVLETPRIEWGLNYSYVRIFSQERIRLDDPRPQLPGQTAGVLPFTTPDFGANGGSTHLAINFTDRLALMFEGGGFYSGNVKNGLGDTTWAPFLGGPRISLAPRSRRWIPSIHGLAGGVYRTGKLQVPAVGPLNSWADLPQAAAPAQISDTVTKFAFAAGGSLDIRVNRNLMIRPFQLDYLYMDRRAPGGNRFVDYNKNNIRYQAGVALAFGGERALPPPPSTKTCPDGTTVAISAECPPPPPPPLSAMDLSLRASKDSLCPGEVAEITPSISPSAPAKYNWTVNGQPLSQGESISFGAEGRMPGAYTITVNAEAEGFKPATAETRVSVLAYQPPAGMVRASPAEVYAGEPVTLTASFTGGQCVCSATAGPFTTTEGAISGNQLDTSSVRFDPSVTTEQQKPITVTATSTDSCGHTFTAATNVLVKKRAAITAQRMPDILFPANNSRVNNCGKRVLLEELKTQIDKDPGGKIVLVGHSGETERQANLDRSRALNAAAILSAGSGSCLSVPANQISIATAGSAQGGVEMMPHFCGPSVGVTERPGQQVRENDTNAQYRRVEVWFVPSGGIMPPSVQNAQAADALGVSRIGCPR